MRTGSIATAATAVAAVAVTLLAAPPADAAGFALERWKTFLDPMHVTTAPGDRGAVYVAQRFGRVIVVRRGRKLRRPFLDLSASVRIADRRVTADHGGLLSVAFAPDYSRSRRLYAFYTHRDGTLHVDEFLRHPRLRDRVARGSRRTVLTIDRGSRFHLGGQIAFGPDGMLWLGTGDQDDGPAAQSPSSPLGKILRLDLSRPGASPQVHAVGLRNPFRFSFAPGGSALIADVGEGRAEEVNVLRPGQPGANFGWNRFEGRRRLRPGAVPGHVLPALVRSHRAGACSIVGGLIVRDPKLRALRGRYLYGDFCDSRLRSAVIRGGRARRDRHEGVAVPYVVAFGEDARRRVYVASLAGPVYRLVARSARLRPRTPRARTAP